MSRAFIKDNDDQATTELPERPQSPHPNFVTPGGLAQLKRQEAELEAQKKAINAEEDLLDKEQIQVVERDLRYVQDRITKAVVVDLAAQPRDRVDFGAIVDTIDENDAKRHFQIVGEDEADPTAGKLSWCRPLPSPSRMPRSAMSSSGGDRWATSSLRSRRSTTPTNILGYIRARRRSLLSLDDTNHFGDPGFARQPCQQRQY